MADLFAPLFGEMQNAAAQIPAALGEWSRVLATEGAPTIARRMAVGDPCELEGCATRQWAGVKCLKCAKVVCLHHAYLSPNGTGICVACANVRRAPPKTQETTEVMAAFALLRLDPQSDEATVTKIVKKLRREHHPDRFPSASDKRAAEAQSRAIGAAHAAIKKARGW